MWDYDGISKAVRDELRNAAARLDQEQATRGLDAAFELELHPLIRSGVERSGLHTMAEQRYPPSRSRARRSEGERCDIVALDPAAGHDPHLADPLAIGTLFAHKGADPAQALWIEVKVVHQYILNDAGIRPNAGYSGTLLRDLTADVRKLARDQSIGARAVLIVLFTDAADTAARDLDTWRRRCLMQSLSISAPYIHTFPLRDRLGNACCTIALAPVHKT